MKGRQGRGGRRPNVQSCHPLVLATAAAHQTAVVGAAATDDVVWRR